MSLEREVYVRSAPNATEDKHVRFWMNHDDTARIHHRKQSGASKDKRQLEVYLNAFDTIPGELAIRTNGHTELRTKNPAYWIIDGKPLKQNSLQLPAKTSQTIWLYTTDKAPSKATLGIDITPYKEQEDILLESKCAEDQFVNEIERAHGPIARVQLPSNHEGTFRGDIHIDTTARKLRAYADLLTTGDGARLEALCQRAISNAQQGVTWYRTPIHLTASELSRQAQHVKSFNRYHGI